MAKGVIRYGPAAGPSFWAQNKKWLIPVLIVAAIIIVLVAVLVGVGISCVLSTKAEAETCVEEFMLAGQAHDIDGAYALCVPGMERADIESLIEDNYAALFANYEGIYTTGFHVEMSGGQTRAALEGSMSYNDGSTHHYEAQLVKIGGEWKISYIYIGY